MSHRTVGEITIATDTISTVGYAQQTTNRLESPRSKPALGQYQAIGDLRLDDRDELRVALAADRDVSDLGLVSLSYERWGDQAPTRITGDFALVVWDEKNRQVYAARDPFGIKPLYYVYDGAVFALSTEVAPLLLLEAVSPNIEPKVVLDYLLYEHYHCTKETFFQRIFRVRPGHQLHVNPDGLKETFYFSPPTQELRFRCESDCYAEFAGLFRRAVCDRLTSDGPIVMDLSGGLDSSSIVCVADSAYRAGELSSPFICTRSDIFPSLPCDESAFIDAVGQAVAFRAYKFDATEPLNYEPSVGVAMPWLNPLPTATVGVRDFALQIGSRVIVSGVGGDQLLTNSDAFFDLVAHGHWVDLVRRARRFQSLGKPWHHWVRKAVRGQIPPEIRNIYHTLRHPMKRPPNWLSSSLQRLWHERSGAPWVPPFASRSFVQNQTWRLLYEPYHLWMLEFMELWMAQRGIERRYPFLDARLAKFVLALPYELRLPDRYERELLRNGLVGVLPEIIRNRASKAEFTPCVEQLARRSLPNYYALATDQLPWCSTPFLERPVFANWLDRLRQHVGPEPTGQEWNSICHGIRLELWLRELSSCSRFLETLQNNDPA